MVPDSSFVQTRWSVVARAGGACHDEARAAMAWLVERYWEPLRRAAERWGCDRHESEDAVQDFCCRLVERRADLSGVDPAIGRFRAWLIVVFRNFLRDRLDRGRAVKRGGQSTKVDLDVAQLTAPHADGEFDRDWALALIDRARDRLAIEHATPNDRRRFDLLSPFLTNNGSSDRYVAAGQELKLNEGAVKVAVHRMRQRFKDLARLEVAETLSDPTPEALDQEMRALAEALSGGNPVTGPRPSRS
jgi:RNA polymerase sigma factor (sigma-70 family)